jgi:hypothetical protein
METNMTSKNPKRIQRGLIWLTAGAATFGVGLGAAGLASAANDTGSTTTTPVATAPAAVNPGVATPPADAPQIDPASLPNGPGETVLTGDTLAKVTAAAEAAQPDATIIRAETDNNGHAYEVHMQLADGSYTTLYFDESFVADGSDTGFGAGPGGPGHHGQHGPQGQQGQPPAGIPGQAPTAPAGTATTGA